MAIKKRAEEVRAWLRKRNIIILLFLLLYGLSLAALLLERYLNIPPSILTILDNLPTIFLTLFIANVIVRIMTPIFSRSFRDELEPEQRIFFAKIFEMFTYGLGLIYLLYLFGVTSSSLVILLGFISGGLAFAIREPVLSFFVWIIILSKKPFLIGDTVKIAEYEGTVERIGTFYLTLNPSSRLGSFASDFPLKVPNRMLMEQPIENYGKKSVAQQVRMQIRSGGNIERAIKDVRNTSNNILEKHDAALNNVFLDIQNEQQKDKHYIVIKYTCPITKRTEIRSKLLSTLLKKKLFL